MLLTALATGGTTQEYKFFASYVDSASITQTVSIKNYSSANTVSWTPTVAATYLITVYARTKGETVNYDAMASIANFIAKVNAPPTISSISNQTTTIGKSVPALPFTISDDITAMNSMPIIITSNNQLLLPVANIAVGGIGASQTVTLTPVVGKSGIATITLTVKDGQGLTATTSFILTVYAPPAITAIPNKGMNVGTVATSALAFTVGDSVTPAEVLTVTGVSSNHKLAPTANIAFGGSGATRTVKITPLAGVSGVTTITLTVANDGGLTTKMSFTLTVYGRPTITAIANKSMPLGTIATSALGFTIGDSVTAATALTVTATSSNVALAAAANVVLGGTGAARTVQITPLPGVSGVTTVTISVTNANGQTATMSFTLTVNAPPTITPIANQTVPLGTGPVALPFTVGDDMTALTALAVTVVSSNTAFVPSANIVLGGVGGARTVKVTPIAGATGVATITVMVKDGGGLACVTSFIYKVYPPPTISSIGNKLINIGTVATSALGFTVSDSVNSAASLAVTGASSNLTLVPIAGLALGGSGASRTVTLTPAAGVSGCTTITLTVTDAGGLTATSAFTLTVNGKPTITPIANQTIITNSATAALAFTISDDLTPPESLTVTGAASYSALIPNANIVLGGTGAARTITVTPATGKIGTATITLTVRDAGGMSVTTSFMITVSASKKAPG